MRFASQADFGMRLTFCGWTFFCFGESAIVRCCLMYLYTYMAQSAYFVNSKEIELIKVKLTYKCVIAENLSVYGKTCESIKCVVCGLLPALKQLLYDRCNSELLTVEQQKSRVWRYFMSYLNNLRI